MYRNKKVEQCVLNFYKILPKSIRQFSFDIKKAILTLNNCMVVSYQEFAKYHDLSINEVIVFCESDTGCTHKDGNNYIIMFNDSPDIIEQRKNFTLAHELAHILLGHLNILESFKIYRSNYTNQHFERDANYFASCVLSPVPVLSKLKPKSTLSIRGVFNLSQQSSEIVFNDYQTYDRNYNIAWHNDILKLFDFQCGLLKYYTYQLDYIYETSEFKPIEATPLQDDYLPAGMWIDRCRSFKKSDVELTAMVAEATLPSYSFYKLEQDWLYPQSLGL